jgi:hypothetical protein
VVNHGGKSKGKPQAAVESAPNIKIPDFGDYRNRANHKAFSPETGVDTRSYPAPPGQSREAAGASTGFL